MANTFKFGNGEWAVGKETVLAYNSENNNFKPLPFSFDRGSIATVVNKDGLIETVGVDEPRIDFLNNPKGHLLLEPQRTNNIAYSTLAFNGGSKPTGWSIGFGTGTYSHTETSYKGQGAVIHTQTTTGRSYLETGFSLSSSTTYTIKVQFDRSRCVNISDDDYILATVNHDGNINKQWSDVDADGVLEVQFTTGADAAGGLRLGFGVIGDEDGGKTIVFSMPQIEAGSYATSYIPTSGSAVTRSAETIEQQTFLMEGLTDMAMFIDYELPNDKNPSDFRNQIGFRDNSNADFYLIQFSNSEQMEFRYRGTAGVNVDMTPTISEATYGLRRKIVYTKTGTTLKVFCNGVEVSSVTNSNATTFSGTTENLHISNNYPKELNIRDWRLYNNGLTDQEAIALTTI